MYKLGFKEAEEPEVKLPLFTGSWRKQGNSRKTYTPGSLTTLKLLTVWITINWKVCEMSTIVQEIEHSLALLFLGIGMKLIFFNPVIVAEFSKFADMLSVAV